MGSRLGQLAFGSWFHDCEAVQIWANSLTSLGLSFVICKMGIMSVLISKSRRMSVKMNMVLRTGWGMQYKLRNSFCCWLCCCC